jgi:hypothetical protein
VNRQLVHLGDAGRGVNAGLLEWMRELADRLRGVRVCCGDWERVCGPTPTVTLGTTGVVLDPPYAEDERVMGLYSVDDGAVSARVREWALSVGDDSRIRIALCGYDTEHEMPGWSLVSWKAHGGYSSQGKDGGNGNKLREVIWFSPHCLRSKQADMFGGA